MAPVRVEGLQDATWVLMDYGDFIVHVFLQETRDYYDLEHLWSGAPRVAWRATSSTPADAAGESHRPLRPGARGTRAGRPAPAPGSRWPRARWCAAHRSRRARRWSGPSPRHGGHHLGHRQLGVGPGDLAERAVQVHRDDVARCVVTREHGRRRWGWRWRCRSAGLAVGRARPAVAVRMAVSGAGGATCAATGCSSLPSVEEEDLHRHVHEAAAGSWSWSAGGGRGGRRALEGNGAGRALGRDGAARAVPPRTSASDDRAQAPPAQRRPRRRAAHSVHRLRVAVARRLVDSSPSPSVAVAVSKHGEGEHEARPAAGEDSTRTSPCMARMCSATSASPSRCPCPVPRRPEAEPR